MIAITLLRDLFAAGIIGRKIGGRDGAKTVYIPVEKTERRSDQHRVMDLTIRGALGAGSRDSLRRDGLAAFLYKRRYGDQGL